MSRLASHTDKPAASTRPARPVPEDVGGLTARIDDERREVSVCFPAGPSGTFGVRLARLADYLASLSDQEFREVGQAVLAARQPSAEKKGGG